MKIIAVANRKGGTGKTSISSNLANEIRRKGIVTVLIDMDSQCDLTKIYLEDDHQLPTILDVLQGKLTVDNACHEVRDNLYLIPGSKDLGKLNLKKSPQLLKKQLRKSQDLKDKEVSIIIIDTPPVIDDTVTTAFAAADQVLIVTQPETFGLANMSKLLEEVEQIKNKVNSKLSILGVVVNKVDNRRSLAKKMMEQLKATFKEDLFSSYISYNTAIPTSQHKNKHVNELGWQSKNVNEFRKLTYEMLERMGMLDDNGKTNAK